MKRPMRFLTIGVFFCLLSIQFYGQDCVTGYCPKTVTAHHEASYVAPVDASITYPVVETNLSGTNMCWIAQNLGATTQATAASDTRDAAAGWYWQFNRKQGYAINTNGTPTVNTDDTRTPNTPWITAIDEEIDWLPANDPCTILLGTGWRIPTNTEWTTADGATAPGGNWANYTNTFDSVLKLHAAGYLIASSAALLSRGANGVCWSSVRNGSTHGYNLGFSSSNAYVSGDSKAYAFSLRCLRAL